MKLNGLLELGERLPAFRELTARPAVVTGGQRSAAPLGVYHAARPYLVALLARSLGRPLILLTARSGRARQWVDELRTWLPDEYPVHFFADPDALPYERIPWAPETRQRRIEALVGLLTTDGGRPTAVSNLQPLASNLQHAPIVVASARSLMQVTLPVREMRLALRAIRQAQGFDANRLLPQWVGWGYESAAVVEAPGQFSRRGGIVDIWPPNLRKPLRIELFGDEIDSLRTFDPSTQRTLERITQAQIGPASEALPKLGERAADRLRGLDLTPCHPPARIEYEREIEALLTGSGFRNLEWWLPYLYSQGANLLDYLPADGLLLVDDAAELLATLGDLEGQAGQVLHDLNIAGDLPRQVASPYVTTAALRQALTARAPLLLGNTTLDGWAASVDTPLARAFTAGPRYGGQMRPIVTEVERSLRDGATAVLVSRQAQRLADIFGEARHAIAPTENVTTPPPPGLTIVQGVMDEGWRLEVGSWKLEAGDQAPTFNLQPSTFNLQPPTSNLWFFTDAELFGWGKPKPRRPQRTRALAPEVFFADVKPGDLVVHIEHGIGRFKGLVKMALDGAEREYLQVEYDQGDQLYVPVHQADRLARYVGPGEGAPALHRLGTLEWEHVKARARKAVAEIADELLELYAAREVVQGHAFSPDAAWQHDLEASFPYVETEDQLVAIEAVKHDMEQPRPMDRLICGDVGYGKTEVALRAAFKAIMDGKQVAVLVPTTVLCQQHYTNFQRRLAAFPVTVAMLSRFQTESQQDRAISSLANGSTDLVVGTHRLLSKDVAFKDLGLLIVDEEQRFGVAHKERIKQLRTEVDVLTLTATPIPRTLHMSLTGVRDLSTIETPPEERLPIKTFVGEFDDTLVRQAILREMDRNGQTYFVHNRVLGIQQMAAHVQKIVPEARIAIGHGQMPERELSAVMLAFAEGEYDILVCTSIIESGLDIPNCNTIIINRADQFGLAQLYQLRGRVGRSAARAYAYLLVDKYKTLTEDSRRRLEALQEASDLGAGFRIAMQDLEIRGAGELLGARQHGHISAVGFDLYTRLLAQAVAEARENTTKDEGRMTKGDGDLGPSSPVVRRNLLEEPLAPTVTLDLNLPARIPESYVPDASLRLQLYRRLAGLTTEAAVDDMRQEFTDRFGPPPEPVENLLYTVQVKVLAINAGIEAISQEDGQLVVKSAALETADRVKLQGQLQAQGIPARVARRAIWLELRGDGGWQRDLVKVLEAVR
jgi:transcription-repair coupling factor (superfamily II helicase)